ncbi:probable sodium/metabolite cotransporter BASS1, chloroplastic [Tanacetum coccineum]
MDNRLMMETEEEASVFEGESQEEVMMESQEEEDIIIITQEEEESEEEEVDEEEAEQLEEMKPPVVTSWMGPDGITVHGIMCIDDDIIRLMNRCQLDDCSICYNPSATHGKHQICCLPCGYGFSCIKKWLLLSSSGGKCPQCNTLCSFQDAILLYPPRLCVTAHQKCCLLGVHPDVCFHNSDSSKFSVMPLSAFFISGLLNLPSYYAAGLILVGCCPGGTASNIVTCIARGNVALSVLMTAASTLSAVVMTPMLTAKLAGQYVAVDVIGLLMSTLQVVLLPVLVDAFMNQYLKGVVKFVSPLMPPFAVATVAILCGNAIAQSSSAILMSGQQVVLAAVLLHISGFFFGYVLSRTLGVDVSSSKTISIEVGMQNSVLGVVLATQHFGNHLTAVPCAVSSVCHLILGSALAGVWRKMEPATQEVKHDP